MKIAFVLTQSLESPSGLGRFGPLARGLAARGHSVELFALHPDFANLTRRVYTDQGVQVTYVSQMHVRKTGARKTYFGPGKLIQVALAATIRLAAAVYRSDAEIIQLCKPQPINSLAVRLGRRGRPVVCDCDDYEAQTNRFGGRWQQAVVRFFEDDIIHYAGGLTANTRFTQQRFQQLGFPPAKILYIPNGVERSRFDRPLNPVALRRRLGLAEDAPLVVYVGTMGVLSHPVDLLLEAFPQVLQHIPQARLLMVGGGEDFDLLQAQAARLGIAPATLFTGPVSPDEVPEYLAAAQVSVDPVRDDEIAQARSPLKVYESLTVGTPVVTSPVGDRSLILADQRYGLLVAPGSSPAIAQGLLALLSDAGLLAGMRTRALQDRRNWEWDTLVDDFTRVYDLIRA